MIVVCIIFLIFLYFYIILFLCFILHEHEHDIFFNFSFLFSDIYGNLQDMNIYVILILQIYLKYVNSGTFEKDKVSEIIQFCEQTALNTGSKLADDFNSPIGNEDADQRLHQDYLTEHLGFAPWMAGGVWKSGGKTLQKSDG